MAVMEYHITLTIDGVSKVFKLDDTYPTVNDWHSATEFTINMAKNSYPKAEVEFIDCASRVHEIYSKWGNISEAPLTTQ